MTGITFHTEDIQNWAQPYRFVTWRPGFEHRWWFLQMMKTFPILFITYLWLLILQLLKEVASCAAKYAGFLAEIVSEAVTLNMCSLFKFV
jgi:hypothetical protein